MSKAIAKKPVNALAMMAGRLCIDPERLKNVLKATAFKDCRSDEEFAASLIVANRYNLNPLTNEIYAFPGKKGGVVPIVPIDGWIKMANRDPRYDGVELKENNDDNGELVSVTAIFHLKGIDHPVIVTEYLGECYDESKPAWRKWKRRMLRHKGYIQGARVAFGFSGIYDEDEAERIIEAQTIESENDKGSVEMPKAKSEQEKPKNGYKEMLESFKNVKEIVGNEIYYEILKKHGYKHCNEIRNVSTGHEIMSEMGELANG